MSTISASTTTTTAYKVTADTTGTLVLQTGASPTTAMTISSSQIVTFANPPSATGAGSVASNTAYGTSALSGGSQTGTNNTAVGYQAMTANTSGSYQVAVGDQALSTNTTGSENTAVGRSALTNNLGGSYSVAVGRSAALNNTSATKTTAIGYQAGYSNTTSNYNTFIGAGAGYTSNATGTTSAANTCVGHESGYSMTSGAGNCFVGPGNGSVSNAAGYLMTTGSLNTILGGYNGNQGGYDIRTSSNYIVLSDGAGNPRAVNNGGSTWSFITNTVYVAPPSGSAVLRVESANGAGLDPYIYLTCPGSNEGGFFYQRSTSRLNAWSQTPGSTGVYLNSNGTSWVSISDERAKDIIEPITDAANKVSTLRAVIGKYKTDEENVRRSFLIAQDVQAVFPEAVADQVPEELGLSYTDVIPLLVAAIKELKAEIDTLKGQA